MTSAAEPVEPTVALFTVAGGNPTATDLAVLTVVLSAVAGSGVREVAAPARSRYNDPARMVRSGSWPSDLGSNRYAYWAG